MLTNCARVESQEDAYISHRLDRIHVCSDHKDPIYI